MKVETEELEYCKLKVSYEADEDVVVSKIDEAVAEIRKLHVPGFRKGKAPDYAIKARCKKQINDWVSREMASQAYDDMVFETNMKPIGMPEYENIKIKGNKFSCDMTVLKKPDFELKPYTGFELDEPLVNDNVAVQVNMQLENLRLRLGDMLPYEEEHTVERGDQITMSFEATIDGNDFEGSTAEGTLYVVGQNMFPDFDDYILGMKAGEEREFQLVFPDDYPDIGGKTADFKVTVHMGTKKQPCEMNEEFFKKVGVESLEELRDKLEKIVKVRIEEAKRDQLRVQVQQRLIDDNDFEVPEFLKKSEAQHLAMQSGIRSWDTISDDKKEAMLKIGEKQVRLSLILDSIRDQEPDAVMNDAEAQNGLAQRVAAQGNDPEQFFVEARKNGTLIGLISALRDEFALQWVINQSKIKEKADGKKEEAE